MSCPLGLLVVGSVLVGFALFMTVLVSLSYLPRPQVPEPEEEPPDVTRSPWYCPECELWVGRKLEDCMDRHGRPRLPLLYEDVDVDNSRRVTFRDRIRAKVRRLLERARLVDRTN